MSVSVYEVKMTTEAEITTGTVGDPLKVQLSQVGGTARLLLSVGQAKLFLTVDQIHELSAWLRTLGL